MSKRIRQVVATCILAMAFPSIASSEINLGGRDFVDACSRPQEAWISFCHGYVQAVIDGVQVEGHSFCVPEGTTRAALVDLVMRQAARMPALAELPAYALVYGVIENAYPCN
jgi:hypothetical protein